MYSYIIAIPQFFSALYDAASNSDKPIIATAGVMVKGVIHLKNIFTEKIIKLLIKVSFLLLKGLS